MPPPGSPCALTPDSEFLDIGSGYGRLAMYVRMRSNISRVTGVEINHCRHKKAVRGRAKIDKLAGPELLRDLELIFGDVRALRVSVSSTLAGRMPTRCAPRSQNEGWPHRGYQLQYCTYGYSYSCRALASSA